MTTPKFEKNIHHIVPQGWQRRFFFRDAGGATGRTGYHKDVRNGQIVGPVGPGEKMSDEWANIVFDEHFRPSDALEDWCSRIESHCLPVIDQIAKARIITMAQRQNVGRWLALQTCRYPDQYQQRLDIGRHLAVLYGDAPKFDDPNSLRDHLAASGFPPNLCPFSDAEFQHIHDLEPNIRQRTVDAILTSHGYEAFYNKGLVALAALPMGSVVTQFSWELLETGGPWFILSDRPVPNRFDAPFATALTYDLAVRISPGSGSEPVADLSARAASPQEIAQINSEVRGRAQQWICGPDRPSIQSL